MTSSFGIQPQRQVRDYFQAPEQPARPAAPAEPTQVPQRRGGAIIDAQRFQEDIKLAQQVKSIEDIVEKTGKLSKSLVKEDAEKQMSMAARLFDQIAQYQLDTLEIGEAAKQLRKKGRDDLADQVVASNPWFRYGWLKTKAEFAGQKTAISTQNWANANMAELEQLEDPAEVTRRVQDYSQSYYQKYYPDVPVQMYSGIVSPVLSKAIPSILEDINEKHSAWKLKTNNQRGIQALTDATSIYAAVFKQGKTSPVISQQANEAWQASIIKNRTDYMNGGGTSQQWMENVLDPMLSNLLLDADDNGINDLVDKNIVNQAKAALNFKLPGLGDVTLLDLISPKNNVSFRTLLNRQHLAAVEAENKMESVNDQKQFRAVRKFKEALGFTLDQLTQGMDPGEAYDTQERLFNEIKKARTGNGVVTLTTQDPITGAITQQEFSVPVGFDLPEARKEIMSPRDEVDPRQFVRDQEEYARIQRENPMAEIPDEILRRYAPGSKEWDYFNNQKLTSRKNFGEKEWSAEITDLEASAAVEAKRLNDLALAEALKSVTGTRQKNAIKAKFANAKKVQVDQAKEFARRFARSSIQSATADNLNNPNWWDTVIKNRMLKVMGGDAVFTEPQQLFPGVKPTAIQDAYMAPERNPNTGEVESSQRMLSPTDFIAANRRLISSGKLQWYYANQPMITNVTAANLAAGVTTQKAFTDDAIADLKDGYGLATQLKPGLTLKQFLEGQFNKNNYNFRGLKLNDQRIRELENRIGGNISKPTGTTQVRHQESGLQHNHNPGAVDFWIEDKKTKSMRVPFAAPVKMEVVEVDFAPGNYGNYSRARVLENYGGLKVGDIISIGHARSFGGLAKGKILYPGNVWGYQHDERSYRVGIDQAITPGAGPHLDITISRAGRRLPQSEMRRIFLNTLVNRLTL